MLSVEEFIENECLRDDNHKFMVLTDYFNNRTFHDNNNNNDDLSLSWIFVVYNEHDYTVLRYAYNLNVLKIENGTLKEDTNDKDNNSNNDNKFIHFNPLKYVDDNIIFSLAPVIRNNEYTMIEKFLYPLHKLYVLTPLSSLLDNTVIINLMPLKPIINKDQADNSDETVYDINDDYTFIDHFKILLSNLIWFDIYIDMKLYEKCRRYIRNYSFYRTIDVIEI